MKPSTATSNERGIAMITTLLMMMLMSALLIGFTAMAMSDQRFRFIDRDRSQAFYGASAGLEKLTADLGNLFFTNVAPTNAQVQALTATQPSITGVSFVKADGTTGYTITASAPTSKPISQGPYQGLTGLVTDYTVDVTARTASAGEVHLTRVTETVAIPVFQFGMFSDVDLSFFAGPNFNFGGRVHTNGNLFLSEGDGATLTLNNYVTAAKEIVRQRLSNGVSIDTAPSHNGAISMTTAPGAFRNLDRTEGSVTDGLSPLTLNAAWHNISLTTYNGWIRNGLTGAKPLNLPLITIGGANTDLVRRPAVNENVTNGPLYGERFWSRVSLRILLSDTAADIIGLPSVTPTAPVQLDGNWSAAPPAGYGPVDAAHPPIATSIGPLPAATTTTAATAAGATTISVNAVPAWYLKPQITAKTAAGVFIAGPFTCATWTDVQFQACNENTANLPAGAVLYVSNPAGSTTLGFGNMPNNPKPSVTLANAVAKGVNITLPLTAGQTTWGFAANTFWITNTAAGGGLSTQVTCSGATATTFTGCTGVPATNNGATITTGALTPQGTGMIGGFLKVEMQKADGTWQDVTMELMNYGIGGPNLDAAPANCADPTPNAILRIQRLRDNGGAAECTNPGTTNSYDWWPNVLFDTREGLQRDCGTAAGNCNNPGNFELGGVMYYVALDVANLSKWFRGVAPYAAGSGLNAITNNGYSVYFSDRRNNRNVSNQETGEYGFEDVVNPASGTGAPNQVLDAGEDVNASGTLDEYGKFPSYNGVASSVVAGSAAPLDGNARPTTLITQAQAQINRAVLYRHALKLINGGLGQIVNPGLTIATENPVYVQGDWNMNVNPPVVGDGHSETSIIADSVTLLSSQWNDVNSFLNPYNPNNRVRPGQSYYRFAVIAGKGPSFPLPAAPAGNPSDFGTDGGAHNFLRYLESGGSVNYVGSIATFYYNRQAVGTYKCCNTVYGAPVRNYQFDTDFLNPATLPPLTPVFRDLNTIGFSQELRTGR